MRSAPGTERSARSEQCTSARLRHDYKSADRLRDQLNEQCVSVNDKTNRWDAADGRSGNIEPFTCDRKL